MARSYGLEVFDDQLRRESAGTVLRVVIDRPDSVTTVESAARPDAESVRRRLEEESVGIADCQRVSQDLSAILDVEDFVPTAYTLEVSSPGLDRPLRHEADYRRFTGRRAKLVMREPVDGQAFVKGRLAGVEGRAVLVDGDDGRRHEVPIDIVTRANLEVEF